jgi:malate dehydrogenase (oxaloacetate-decarboxylating)
MDDEELYPREAAAVGLKAIEQGVAQKSLTKRELIATASKIIARAKRQTQVLMDGGVLVPNG